MWLLVLALLIWAAVAGVLWQVVKIALGVALGLWLFGAVVAVTVYLLVRSRFRRWERERRGGSPTIASRS